MIDMKSQRIRLTSRHLAALVTAALTAGQSLGAFTNFDTAKEGLTDVIFQDGGITFFEAWNGFPPVHDSIMAIDDGTDVWTRNPDMLDFVQGSLLNTGAVSVGSGGFAFTATKTFKMTTGRIENHVALSIAYVVREPSTDYSNNTVGIQALRDGQVVATDTFQTNVVLGQSGGGSFTFGAGRLELSGVDFDTVQFFATGPSPFGSILGAIDNVTITPEPGSFLTLALLLAAFGVRRP